MIVGAPLLLVKKLSTDRKTNKINLYKPNALFGFA